MQDYSATTPGALAAFPSELRFVGASSDSTDVKTISVLGADAQRLFLAARADTNTCTYLRDDRATDRVETVTITRTTNCNATDAPPEGWQEILVD